MKKNNCEPRYVFLCKSVKGCDFATSDTYCHCRDTPLVVGVDDEGKAIQNRPDYCMNTTAIADAITREGGYTLTSPSPRYPSDSQYYESKAIPPEDRRHCDWCMLCSEYHRTEGCGDNDCGDNDCDMGNPPGRFNERSLK